MSLRIQNSRQLLKRTNVSGATPTVNTGSTQHTDGTWTVDEIYAGELYWNMQDIPKKLYLGWEDISGNTGVELIYPGFTGGSGSCITDLYVSNIFGCSPITIWDNFIQKDGTSINSEDTKLKVTFDDTGEGVMTITKTGGTWTDLDSITVGNAGIQMQTSTSATTAYMLIENTNLSGTDLNLQLVNTNIITNEISVLGLLEGSAGFSTYDGISTTNSVGTDTNKITLVSDDTSLMTLPTRYEQTPTEINIDAISLFSVTGATINVNGGNQILLTNGINQINMNDAVGNIIDIRRTDGVNFDNSIVITDTQIILRTDDNVSSSQITIEPTFVGLNGGGNVQIVISDTNIRNTKGSTNKYYDLGANGTTNATPIAIGTISFSGTTDKVITIDANVNGIDSSGNKGYGAKLFAVFKNIGGVITQLSTTDKSEKTDFATATSDIVISGTDIIIQVTGELATNINWETDFSYHITA